MENTLLLASPIEIMKLYSSKLLIDENFTPYLFAF